MFFKISRGTVIFVHVPQYKVLIYILFPLFLKEAVQASFLQKELVPGIHSF
jgi:hypothetical protein